MGMDLYNSSSAARAVWKGDAHLLTVYSFSIVEIVKDNPEEKTIHFGAVLDMAYDTMDKDGVVNTHPFFAHICTAKYTFSHPHGLLFATQFTQIALVVTEQATFKYMRAKGFVQKDCASAGHSLGEYSALASMVDVLHISALVDVIFYRGIMVQRAIEHDAHSCSNYAMCAVIDTISTCMTMLLEIDNYNVKGQQYVCAGELLALQTMTNVLNYLKVLKINIHKVKEMLGNTVMKCFKRAKEKQQAEGYIKLERGFAIIYLPSIDVFFHSPYLWNGTMPFRACLSKKANPSLLNPDMLIGKYIPKLFVQPFNITHEYAQLIYYQAS
ncbi:acyl transferase domain-containing protein [Suillus discolor]|uniref:Acyl transferase domain-containing protein n=1 Tax=Suillus discolor TaxID=1912936 RepID=A0A9P7FEL0_9AGAM|nr:acyl transferase domain-containing protein [Suillus discolor]KAG2114723.1 acyl transferase domain-containing protein [Suillus discolor]